MGVSKKNNWLGEAALDWAAPSMSTSTIVLNPCTTSGAFLRRGGKGGLLIVPEIFHLKGVSFRGHTVSILFKYTVRFKKNQRLILFSR